MRAKAKQGGERKSSAALSRRAVVVYTIAAGLALCGLADAIFLTVQALTGETAVCGGSTGCAQVLGSAYARVGPIPLAGFGTLAYFTAFSFAIFAAFGYRSARKFFALSVAAMFVVTLWLLYLQAFVLHAFCRYCLLSAAITFLLAGLVVAGPSPSRRSETP